MKPRDKRVPTFGTASEYMQLLWRMDAIYSGNKGKRDKGSASPRTYCHDRAFSAGVQDTVADEQIEAAGVEGVFAVTKHHVAE